MADNRTTNRPTDCHGSDLGPLPAPIERMFEHGCVAACIMGAYRASDRGGKELSRVIPRNPCQDNDRYLHNGSSSAAASLKPCRRRRRRTRRSPERPSARPPPEGGRGVRVCICIDNYIRCVFKSGFVDRGSTFLYMHATCGQHSYLMTPRRCWGVF